MTSLGYNLALALAWALARGLRLIALCVQRWVYFKLNWNHHHRIAFDAADLLFCVTSVKRHHVLQLVAVEFMETLVAVEFMARGPFKSYLLYQLVPLPHEASTKTSNCRSSRPTFTTTP